MRFVILSQPRTGSSLLSSSLNSHPQIYCRDEVLNAHQADRFQDLPWSGRNRFLRCLTVSGVRAVGCKLHASDPNHDLSSPLEWEAAWDALFEDPEIRVICLYRQDVIAQLASWKVARTLNQWGLQSHTERPQVSISPHELEWFLKWNQIAYQARLGRLMRHVVFYLSYEDLSNDWHGSLANIQRLLQVEILRIPPSSSKSETRKLNEVVQNYDELAMLPGVMQRVVIIPRDNINLQIARAAH